MKALYRKEYVKHVGFGEGDDGWNIINNESGEIIGQAHTEAIADAALSGLNRPSEIAYHKLFDHEAKDWMVVEDIQKRGVKPFAICRYKLEADADEVVRSLNEGTPLPLRLLKIIVVGDRYWGSGSTVEEARKVMNKEAGHTLTKYIVYVVHPTARIDEMGSFCWHGGRTTYLQKEIQRVGMPPRPLTQPEDQPG